MNQVLQRNAFRNQNDSLINKNGVTDLMQVLLKQIQMLTTFDKYNLLLSLYIYLEMFLLKMLIFCFSNLYRCISTIKYKGKGKKGESSSSSKARSGTSANLFAVMVLLNFYLHVFIHYYFIASHLIYFIVVFVCKALRRPNTDRRPSLGFARRGPAGDGRHSRRF
jgi:hypothetical protein